LAGGGVREGAGNGGDAGRDGNLLFPWEEGGVVCPVMML
jgi:hypothetical protein